MYEVRRAGAPVPRPSVTPLGRLALGAVAMSAACAPSEGIRLEPLHPGYEPTSWRSVRLYETEAEVQRDFVRVGLLLVEEPADPPRIGTLDRMRQRASELGANAIVLRELRSDGPSGRADGEEVSSEPWRGIATAIRILDGRWGDRYWRYGATPEPLAQPTSIEQPEPGWQRLQIWRGSDDRKTDAFSIPGGEWRVVWYASASEAGNLEILVYRLPDDILTARIGQDGAGAGSYLGLAGTGTYYLSVHGEGVDWEVAVDTWSPATP